jgi:hypothetical protein
MPSNKALKISLPEALGIKKETTYMLLIKYCVGFISVEYFIPILKMSATEFSEPSR